MNQIQSNKSLRLKMRGDEHFQYATEAIVLIENYGAANLKIEPLYQDLLHGHKCADNALRQIAKSAFTAEVKKADKRRDTALAAINETVRTAEKHFDQQVSDAAKNVKRATDVYKSIAKLPLNEQTAAVYNLLQELNGKFAADAATVGITQWVAELQEANNHVANLMRDRRQEAIDEKPQVNMKTARKMMDAAIDEITKRVNALAMVEGNVNYAQFINAVNKLSDDFKNVLNRRLASNNNS